MARSTTTPGRRWDTDTRGRGIADARSALPAIERLAAAMTIDGWVAEEPEAHLLPHLEQAAEALGLQVLGKGSIDGAFDLQIAGDGRSQGELRAAAINLVASIAETSTHVRQTADGAFEVVTGMLEGDNPAFATHGHVVRIRFA
jgi:hypothetical protein